ncbi:RNA-binding motif protein, Y chromosome, family 1 member B-like [Chionomys nivalis]|uniref:RNA-binding motif protein, Y chromosome, family 1 member B-like n=1 Tax=Chionomys nivalis TaxID=269649 RepID=UPI00259884A8|nr:RNA-binding motif protein, Y chromosome, family 1 member B-like [Chionomys nivalis]
MAEADQPGKIFIGGLNIETKQKTLQIVFGRFGPMAQVILMKDRETKKSRGFAFITFQHPLDAKNAIREMNGVSLDGKKIKVEQASRPSLESGSRWRPPPISRGRGYSRILKCGRRQSSRARSHPSHEEHLDDCGYTPDFNMSSWRHFAVKRSLSSKNEGPSLKRSTLSALTRSSTGLRGQEPHGREISRNVPRKETLSSRRDDYLLPRDYGHSSKDREYASTSRGYRYRNYDFFSSQDEHTSKVFSEHAGYSGGQDKDYSEYSSGSSYRDTYEKYGSFCVAPSARGTYRGNNRYDDYRGSRDGYSGSQENHSSSRSDTYSRGYEHSSRQGTHPPFDREYLEHGSRQEREHSSMDRLYMPSHESYSSSSRFKLYWRSWRK